MDITDKVKNADGHCPFCGHDSLTMKGSDGNLTLTLTWECDKCEKEWVETYKFVSAEQSDT